MSNITGLQQYEATKKSSFLTCVVDDWRRLPFVVYFIVRMHFFVDFRSLIHFHKVFWVKTLFVLWISSISTVCCCFFPCFEKKKHWKTRKEWNKRKKWRYKILDRVSLESSIVCAFWKRLNFFCCSCSAGA